MAKKEKGRLRVFFAEFEGDDETIQEGLRSIGMAVTKTFQPTTKIVRISESAIDDDPDLDEFEEAFNDDSDILDVPSKKPSKKRSNRKPPVMSIVKDLDLKPDGNPAFCEFIAEKKPKDNQEFIVCAVYYLAHKVGQEGITPNHVYTCFKDASRRTPKDLPQTLRNVACRKGWVDSKKQDDIKITNVGDNYVEHDLPHSGGEES